VRDLTPIKPHPVSFLADPLLVKERVKIIKSKIIKRRLSATVLFFFAFSYPLLNKERVGEEQDGVRSLFSASPVQEPQTA